VSWLPGQVISCSCGSQRSDPTGAGSCGEASGTPRPPGARSSLCSCPLRGISAPGAKWVPLFSNHTLHLLQIDQVSPNAPGHCILHPDPLRTRDTRRGAMTCLLCARGRAGELSTAYLHEQCQGTTTQVHHWKPLQ